MTSFGDLRVTILARNVHHPRVQLVTKRDGLFRSVTLAWRETLQGKKYNFSDGRNEGDKH